MAGRLAILPQKVISLWHLGPGTCTSPCGAWGETGGFAEHHLAGALEAGKAEAGVVALRDAGG